jgi:hypothetical protein
MARWAIPEAWSVDMSEAGSISLPSAIFIISVGQGVRIAPDTDFMSLASIYSRPVRAAACALEAPLRLASGVVQSKAQRARVWGTRV